MGDGSFDISPQKFSNHFALGLVVLQMGWATLLGVMDILCVQYSQVGASVGSACAL